MKDLASPTKPRSGADRLDFPAVAVPAQLGDLTLSVDYWSLVWPRFVQGFGMGFLFLPLTTLSISTIPKTRLPNATAAFNLIRNMGGSIGVAMATTLLVRRSQYHQATLVGHVDVWDPETTAKLARWGLAADSSAGAPLSHCTVGVLIGLVARAPLDPCDPVRLLEGLDRRGGG